MNYLYYLVIFTTGLCSLVYQVVWQRYLHLLVGSEARSTTIIVAIFLLGLSLGYYLFGKLSLRFKDRHEFLKFYGYVEVATGAYAIIFPKLFNFINNSGLPNTNYLSVDIFVGLLLLLFPTILMGATVPVMTTVLPNNNNEVNQGHAIIYGVNTLGAFLGVLLSTFFLIPQFGISLTLTIVGAINFFCGLIYMGNRLTGPIDKQEEMPTIESNYKKSDIYLLAFTSGLVTISLEIIWIRLMGLSLGSSFLIFPIVLSIFILGLGLGSLSLKKVSVGSLHNQYRYLLGFLILSYVLAPHVPLWFSNLRVSLGGWISSYYLFIALSYLLAMVVLLSFVFPLGRLLPMSYAFLEKDSEQFGFNCGMLYFINTLGTFVGSVVFSYILFYFFDIETIYKLNIIILVGTFALLYHRDKKYNPVISSVVCVIILIIFGEWNRRYHVQGLFRSRSPEAHNFRGIFHIHPYTDHMGLIHLEDGPNTTVGVIEENFRFEDGTNIKGRSIFVNGKSDSSTAGDFSTLSLLGVIPYAYAGNEKNLQAAVIGQGTGVSAGILGVLEDVEKVDLIEISPAVYNTLPMFSEFHYDAHKNPKIESHQLDAFKFFRQSGKKYDVILSEPTNPWVVGVENLYTPYFYKLMADNMNEDGILMQWMHSYSMSKDILRTIFANARQHFPYLELYQTGISDIGLIASKVPIRFEHTKRRLNENLIKNDVYKKINMEHNEAVYLTRIFSSREMNFIVDRNKGFLHTIEFPTLGIEAYKSFFMGNQVTTETLLDPYVARLINRNVSKKRFDYLMKFKEKHHPQDPRCRFPRPGIFFDTYCIIIKPQLDAIESLSGKFGMRKKLFGYSLLRKKNFIEADKKMLLGERDKFFKDLTNQTKNTFNALINEFVKEGWYREANNINTLAYSKNIISKKHFSEKKSLIEAYKDISNKLFNVGEWP